jgi:hypothetical protein
MRTMIDPAFAARAVPGLLVDRYSGLIHYPAWLAGLAGCAAWWGARHGRVRGWFTPARAVFLAAVPYLLVLLCYNSWEGGSGAPSRLLVVVFPVLALGLAALDRRLPAGGVRTLVLTAVWLGVAHVLLMLYVPPLAFLSAKQKVESLLVRAAGVDPLAVLPAIPDFLLPPPPVLPVLIWAAVLAAVWVLIYKALRARS